MDTVKPKRKDFDKLKNQVITLKRRELASRNKLRIAISKIQKLNKTYQHKLDQRMKDVTRKAAAESVVCVKLANAIKQNAKKATKITKKLSIQENESHGKSRKIKE